MRPKQNAAYRVKKRTIGERNSNLKGRKMLRLSFVETSSPAGEDAGNPRALRRWFALRKSITGAYVSRKTNAAIGTRAPTYGVSQQT